MLAIVANDAGGAEILSSYARRETEPMCFVLEGPARTIFERKLGAVRRVPLHEAIEAAKFVLTGTSWSSELELDALEAARRAGKISASFLDHWVNYRERFCRGERSVLPDEIWVGDEDAERLAEAAFAGRMIVRKPNPYYEDLRAQAAAIGGPRAPGRAMRVLYICEPLKEHALRQHGDERYWGYTEEDALNWFLENRGALGMEVGEVVIRPHPAEARDKYAWVATRYGALVRHGAERSLLEEIVDSDVVVGCESMAMVVALLANRRVVSCIPPGGRRCSLPHAGVEHLQELVSRRETPGP